MCLRVSLFVWTSAHCTFLLCCYKPTNSCCFFFPSFSLIFQLWTTWCSVDYERSKAKREYTYIYIWKRGRLFRIRKVIGSEKQKKKKEEEKPETRFCSAEKCHRRSKTHPEHNNWRRKISLARSSTALVFKVYALIYCLSLIIIISFCFFSETKHFFSHLLPHRLKVLWERCFFLFVVDTICFIFFFHSFRILFTT